MDGAPLVRAAARKPGDIGKPTIKTYACDDAESGVALLKEKFANAVEQSSGGDTGRLLFKQELEWGTEEHPWMISYQLRNAELWEHYQKIRK